jgi:hypothetical protein
MRPAAFCQMCKRHERKTRVIESWPINTKPSLPNWHFEICSECWRAVLKLVRRTPETLGRTL